MTDNELAVIGELIRTLPAFEYFNSEMLPELAATCAEILSQEDGLETLLGLVRENLPERLRETAYLLACDVAAADGEVQQEELRLLELIRHRLDIDRLSAAAIERAARARFQTI